jgi:hypothetical protein
MALPTPVETPIKELGLSIVRTFVPPIVAVIITWATGLGATLDDATATAFVTAVITAAYYLVVRVLEVYVAPWFGWLLGAARAPAYKSNAIDVTSRVAPHLPPGGD